MRREGRWWVDRSDKPAGFASKMPIRNRLSSQFALISECSTATPEAAVWFRIKVRRGDDANVNARTVEHIEVAMHGDRLLTRPCGKAS
jgi:hypothetical protein